MKYDCYISGVNQVSSQIPLSEEWLLNPVLIDNTYSRAIEPDIKQMISPIEARRMSKILKRALATALTTLKETNVNSPDAIIMGTGKGCLENSEKFLTDLSEYGENGLKPSLFMQSTHNTISSLIAINLKCHAYNNTYSHLGVSFESALMDAWIQISHGRINTALVGAHDEVTPLMSTIMRENNPEVGCISESSVTALLSNQGTEGQCKVAEVRIFHKPDMEELTESLNEKDQILLLGLNGNVQNDSQYHNLLGNLGFSPAVLKYKNIFGENFSSSAIAFYVAVTLLKNQRIPEFMIEKNKPILEKSIKRITVLNHSENTDWGLIRIER